MELEDFSKANLSLLELKQLQGGLQKSQKGFKVN
jgi:hypothetical protein